MQSSPAQPDPVGVQLVTVAKGEFSGVAEMREVVVRDAAEWEALWRVHAAEEAPPAVAFSERSAAAVFLGTRPTGGFSVEITGASREGAAVVLQYVEHAPAASDIVTQVLTSPFHIVTFPRHEGPVRFEKR